MDTYVQCGKQSCKTANFSTSLMKLTNINQPITKLLSNKDALWWAEPLQCCMQDKWHEHTWELPSAHCKESLRLSGEALIRFTSSWDSEFFLKPKLLSLSKKSFPSSKWAIFLTQQEFVITEICHNQKTKPFSWLRKMFFVLSQARDKEKILSPHEELNLWPSNSMHQCSTTELQRLYSEQGLLRSSYDMRPAFF